METKVETLEDNRVKITVTVPAAEIDRRIAKQYKEFARTYNFPGFRKGKAPRPVIDNALGAEAVRANVTDDVVNDNYPMAIDDAALATVGQPEFGDFDLVEAGKDYEFSLTVGVMPQLELDNYDAVEINMPEEGATEEEIQAQIDSLTSFYIEYTDARANTKVKKDSYVDLKISATDDQDKEIDTLKFEKRMYKMGSGQFPAAFDEKIVGLKKGDNVEVELEVAADEDALLLSDLAGKTKSVKMAVEVLAVKKETKPELTDEWVSANLGFESAEELRTRVVETIEEQKADILPRLKEEQSLRALASRLQGEPSESLVEETEADLLQNFFGQLQRQGMTLDNYLAQQGITSEQFQEDIKKQAKDVATQDTALDAWIRHFNITASDEEVEREFADANVGDVKKVMEEWRKAGRLHLIRQGLARQKAIIQIMEDAVVSPLEPKGSK